MRASGASAARAEIEPAGTGSAEHLPDARELKLQRTLKVVVVVLGVLIFAGLAVIIGRILYVASQPSQPSRDAAPEAALSQTSGTNQQLDLPSGAEIRSISLSGNRLAVHYNVGGKAGVAVLDLATGRRITTIELQTQGAGN
jgi:hypothetical protein